MLLTSSRVVVTSGSWDSSIDLQVVYLKPELIGAFETFELTCEFLMYRYWDQGDSQGELEAVHISDSDHKPQTY